MDPLALLENLDPKYVSPMIDEEATTAFVKLLSQKTQKIHIRGETSTLAHSAALLDGWIGRNYRP